MSWTIIGKNPYGDFVYENLIGERCLFSKKGQVLECPEKAYMFCRASSATDVSMLTISLCSPDIFQSFQKDIARAFVVFKTKKGETFLSTKEYIDKICTENSSSWSFFLLGWRNALGEKALRAWAEKRGFVAGMVAWGMAMSTKNHFGLRGVQVGMASMIEHRLRDSQFKNEYWSEVGIYSNTGSALWRVPLSSRSIECRKVDIHPSSPKAKEVTTFLTPTFRNGVTNGFNPQKEVKKEINHGNKMFLLWCNESSPLESKSYFEGWFRWLSTEGLGVVVFQSLDTPLQHVLMMALKSTGKLFERLIIKDEDGVATAAVWSILPNIQKIDTKYIPWMEWCGRPPILKDVEYQEETDYLGRVSYRSATGIASEGFAPKRLEQSMWNAFQEAFCEEKEKGVEFSKSEVLSTVAKNLEWEPQKVLSRLSGEQVDAVWMALRSLSKNEGLILADETGFGKGRILAAIMLAGIHQKKPIVFITENEQLFSDFTRDLEAINALPHFTTCPILLHQSATVFKPDGSIWTKSKKGNEFLEMLKEKKWNLMETQVIFTTYAQLNRENKKQPKIAWLKNRLQGGWLILDEAHNASGASNVSENLQELMHSASGVIFSSATFAKHEDNLELYNKVLPLDKRTLKIVKQALGSWQSDGIREALTIAMAEEGRFIRREHAPVPSPQPIWLKMDTSKQQQLTNFSKMWRAIFEATDAFEKATGTSMVSSWQKLGAALSRSVKEFSLLLKIPDLVLEIERMVQNDEKVVITIESTFESALKNALEWVDVDGKTVMEKQEKVRGVVAKVEHPLLWKYRWLELLNKHAPQGVLTVLPQEGNVIKAMQKFETAVSQIQMLDDWDLAPLDRIKEQLASKGILSLELSGRSWETKKTIDSWTVQVRPSIPRSKLVAQFNDGTANVIFLSRAGCAGISLHAGRFFKDQRVRNLIELDMASNPANRVQFWGRVRRRDQVCEPNFFGLMLDTLFDRRIYERETKKQEKLSAHSGYRKDLHDVSWVSPLGEAIVTEWAYDFPTQARHLGIFLTTSNSKESKVEKVLSRAIILEDEDQMILLKRLERGVLIGTESEHQSRVEWNNSVSKVVRRKWVWGDYRATWLENGMLGMPRIDVVERVWNTPPVDAIQQVVELLSQTKEMDKVSTNGSKFLSWWFEAFKRESLCGYHNSQQKKYVWTWLSSRLPLFQLGFGLQLSSPSTDETVRAIFLNFVMPENFNELENGIWGLSQFGIKIWVEGDTAPMIISLLKCYKDSNFRLWGMKIPSGGFKNNGTSHIGLTIEGNQVIAAHWGQRWGLGQAKLVNDEEMGHSWVWGVPRSFQWEDMLKLPRDVVSVEQAIQFLKTFQNKRLSATLPLNQHVWLSLSAGMCTFSFDGDSYQKAQATWLTFNVDKLLSKAKINEFCLERSVSIHNIKIILYSIQTQGISWRMPIEDENMENWYKNTSIKFLE